MRMQTSALILATVLSAGVAKAQGDIGTIARGTYVCELPGDAGGAAGIAQPAAGFSIDSAGRYASAQGTGTYLRRGDRVSFTSGPRNGETYQVMSRDFLRKLEADGQPGRLRCIRQSG
mgnify:FL=1